MALRLTWRVSLATMIIALTCTFTFSAPALADPWGSESASVGVLVESTPDAPATTVPGLVDTPSAPSTPSTQPNPAGTATTVPSHTSSSMPEAAKDVWMEDRAAGPLGVAGNVKSAAKAAAKAAKAIAKGILSGKPVADVLQNVLPKPVADVVVPAVRTASTFVFPIGLAGAVLAFLVLQNRVDASDPKLTAAPFAHDDDVVEFV